jgi:hypothetical protein
MDLCIKSGTIRLFKNWLVMHKHRLCWRLLKNKVRQTEADDNPCTHLTHWLTLSVKYLNQEMILGVAATNWAAELDPIRQMLTCEPRRLNADGRSEASICKNQIEEPRIKCLRLPD